jgi:hypothetical protein
MSENKDLTNIAKETGSQLVGNLYTDFLQPSIKTLGTTLGSVVELITLFQVPIQYVNEKVKLNFSKRLKEYAKKLEEIPDEKKCEVNPQIGVPTIERLGYITNDEIADLFTNLLTKASSVDTVNLAHPSFVQLIERLSVDEARIIKYLFNEDKEYIPCVSFRTHFKNEGGFVDSLENGTSLSFEIDFSFPKNEKLYLDNLVSMGILDISHGKYFTNEAIYESLYKLHKYEQLVEKTCREDSPFDKIDKIKSYYQITDFGKAFITACNNIQ